MTVFTPQERRVVLFLIVSLLAGTSVRIWRDRRRAAHVPTQAGFVELQSVRDSASIPELDTLIEEVERMTRGEKRKVNRVVDLNAASESDLCLLPGIGPKLARRIVNYRRAHGKFKSTGDLTRIAGIGEKKLAAIQGLVFVGEPSREDEEFKQPPERQLDGP